MSNVPLQGMKGVNQKAGRQNHRRAHDHSPEPFHNKGIKGTLLILSPLPTNKPIAHGRVVNLWLLL
jgi:hypothetical protein